MNRPDLATLNDSGELISGISYDILNSEMTNKELQWCFWDESSQQLVISFLKLSPIFVRRSLLSLTLAGLIFSFLSNRLIFVFIYSTFYSQVQNRLYLYYSNA
jgi:hypothetical protein